MKEKIEGKGYIVEDIILEVQDDEEYTINKITLDLKKQKNNSWNCLTFGTYHFASSSISLN